MKRTVLRSLLVLLASWAMGHAVWAAAEPAAAGKPAPWPSNGEGVLLRWQDGTGPALAFDPAGKPAANYFLTPTGLAWLDRNYAMNFQNGAFPLDQGSPYLLARLKASNRMSIEMTVTTHYLASESFRSLQKSIVAFSSDPMSQNFVLEQGAGTRWDTGWLCLRLNTSVNGAKAAISQVNLYKLTRDRPVHIVVTYEPGLVVCYADGKRVYENRGLKGDFSQWEPQSFQFGGGGDPVTNEALVPWWRGSLEGFCLYDRVLGEQEVARNCDFWRQRIAARTIPPQLQVQAKLLSKSKILTPEQAAPYRRELATHEYEVEQVLGGECKAQRIRVAHWVMMDRTMLAESQEAIGKSCRLTLEPFNDDPQLSSELISDTLPLDAALTLYVDAGRLDEKPVDAAKVRALADAKDKATVAARRPAVDLSRIAAVTGARTRIVWLRRTPGAPQPPAGSVAGDTLVEGWNALWSLMGLDTSEGKERTLLAGPVSCASPWITADGSRVIFSDAVHDRAYVMDWDGGNKRLISQDRCYYTLCYWRDPQSGVEWAYLGDHGTAENPPGNCSSGQHICRVQLDNPSIREPVYNGETEIRFRVSADGKFGGGGFPYPRAGMVSLAGGAPAIRGQGCVVNFAPDNSHRLFHYDGTHRSLVLYDGDGGNVRKIAVADRPEFSGMMTWATRWSNNARFFALAGPLRSQYDPGNCGVYLCEFDETFTGLTDMLPVTGSPQMDTSPSVWIEPPPAERIAPKEHSFTPLPPVAPPPPSPEAAAARESAADWTNSIGMKFRRIAAGSFTRGGAENSRQPRHKVTLTQSFFLGVFEVTQEQWEKVMGNNPAQFPGPMRPVETVSWLDAQEFLKKLSALDKTTYRLPTDAEWEYACRAGTDAAYSWGAAFDGSCAWVHPNSGGQTHEVGARRPNAWGLYDMAGNVFEWTADATPGKAKAGADERDPHVPVDPRYNANALYRGGAYSSDPERCASAARTMVSGLGFRAPAIGFRVARDAEPGPASPAK